MFFLCLPVAVLLGRAARRGYAGRMNDFIFVALAVGFFVLAIVYAYFCEKVR